MDAYHPVIVAVLMIKDEEPVIADTLQPMADGGIDSFFIFDTGSTDGTIAKVHEFFAQHKDCTYYLEQENFVDFSTSRNRALELARERFADAAFMLMPDAEWYLHNVPGLIDFCKRDLATVDSRREEGIDIPDAYLVRIIHPTMDFYTPRLIRCNTSVKFVGVVHEVLMPPATLRVDSDVFFELGITKQGYAKSQKRWERDRDLLLKHYYENPNNSRTAFYLAQTYECLGDYHNAAKYYKRRIAQDSWNEEDFMALYRMGRVVERLARDGVSGYTWAQALEYYLVAHAKRANRIEPLVYITKHYLDEKNMALAFIFAQRAAQVPYPYKDVLFVEKEMYEYTRFDFLAQCAWYIGEYDIGIRAIELAQAAHPDLPHLKHNLRLYQEAKKNKHAQAVAG